MQKINKQRRKVLSYDIKSRNNAINIIILENSEGNYYEKN